MGPTLQNNTQVHAQLSTPSASLQTPLQNATNLPGPNRRSIAQQRRRQRERAEKEAGSHLLTPPATQASQVC